MPVAQIYAGYVGGDFPLMDISNLWGLYPSAEAQLAVIDAVQPEMARITRGERRGPDRVHLHRQQLFLLQAPGEIAGRIQRFEEPQP